MKARALAFLGTAFGSICVGYSAYDFATGVPAMGAIMLVSGTFAIVSTIVVAIASLHN